MHESFWDEIERSRKLTEQERSRDTLELIDRVRELNLAGIRMQYPDATPDEVEQILLKRRAIIRDLESRT
jgi:hypothetical protein